MEERGLIEGTKRRVNITAGLAVVHHEDGSGLFVAQGEMKMNIQRQEERERVHIEERKSGRRNKGCVHQSLKAPADMAATGLLLLAETGSI